MFQVHVPHFCFIHLELLMADVTIESFLSFMNYSNMLTQALWNLEILAAIFTPGKCTYRKQIALGQYSLEAYL